MYKLTILVLYLFILVDIYNAQDRGSKRIFLLKFDPNVSTFLRMNHTFPGFGLLFKSGSLLSRYYRFFLFLFILCLVATLILYYLKTKIQSDAYTTEKYRQTLVSTALKAEEGLQQVTTLFYRLFSGQQKLRYEKLQGVWAGKVQFNLDKLAGLADELNDKELQEKIRTLKKDAFLLESAIKNMLGGMDRSNVLTREKEGEYNFYLNKLVIYLDEISASQEMVIGSQMEQMIRSSYQGFLISLVVTGILLLTGMLYPFRLIRQMYLGNEKVRLRIQELEKGNLQLKDETLPEEVKPLMDETRQLAERMEVLKKLAVDVGAGRFDTDVVVFSEEGELGQAFVKMRESLAQIAIEDRQRNWFNEGFARFGEILRKTSTDISIFYDSVISNLVKYVGASQGGIFVVVDELDSPETFIELKAGYAYERRKFIQRQLTKEEGLIGQVWREKDSVLITDIPSDYSLIVSGSGYAKPNSILVTPLISNEAVMGVVELAFIEKVEEYKIEFVKQLTESIASTIARIKADEATQKLLRITQEKTEIMTVQEEEMRTQMEELVTTQEKLEANAIEIELQLNALNQAFIMNELDLSGNFTKVNKQMLTISKFSESELLGKSFTILFDTKESGQKSAIDLQHILLGNTTKGEFIRVARDGRRFWVYEVVYPLYEPGGRIKKICTISYDITREKEQDIKIAEQLQQLQMSKRDVVNRIREVEQKYEQRIKRIQAELSEQILEKDRIIQGLKQSI